MARANHRARRRGRSVLLALALVFALAPAVSGAASPVGADAAVPVASLDLLLGSGSDDAEEAPDGTMSLVSTDLELVTVGRRRQTVGLRFSGVAVPESATILSAHVQFQVDEVSEDAAELEIQGEAVADAAAFTIAPHDVSSRPRTSASVAWVPPAWSTVGERGAAQRTPDLRPVVQEVVAGPGWASGNALALIMNGSGRRTAEAFDGTAAPTLHIDYELPGGENRAPSVDAGPDQSVALPNGAHLNGTVIDDGLPNPPGTVTTTWSAVDGPAPVAFSEPNAVTTTATFPLPGTYVLRLAATDSELTAADDLTVTVRAPDSTFLPGDIPGISPEAQGHVGPFRDGNGNLYTVAEITAADPRMKMMKSSDGGRTWAEVDGANRPARADLEAVWIVQQGTTLHIVHQKSSAAVYHHAFSMSDSPRAPDRWMLMDEPVASPADPPEQYVSLVVLSTGDLWAFYGNGTHVGYRKKPVGGSWSSERAIDTVSTGQVVAVRGANDKTHVFYKDLTHGQIEHRSLTADGTLSPAERVDDNGLNAKHSPMTNAVYYDDDGVETVVVAWADTAGMLKSARVLGDATPTEEVAVSQAPVLLDPGITTNRAAVAHLAVDEKNVHAVWADGATADIVHDTNDDDAGWGIDTVIRDGVAANWLYCGVFTHSPANGGAKVLGFLYDNNVDDDPDTADIEYDELVLAP